ncbi:hypothetical protein O181_041197 [Austropuccinia psidii MF-1]|uniref:Integrase zinc-binding domain-containing protein n=1 Tax=Austropuccinia psidii MF-1 TaxID=1389203 RepID=A0A9Q3DKB2_9BASI|nr:hypothetical protein [Austropuccinia psidii MF-1]
MNFKQIIKQDEVQPSRFFSVKVDFFSNLIGSIQKKLWQDSQYRIVLQELGKGKSVQDHSLDSSSQIILFKDQVVVPNDPTIQLSMLQKLHDSDVAGHPGQENTLNLVKWDFTGPPKNCLKDFWAPFPILMEVITHKKKEATNEEAPVASTSNPQVNPLPQEGKKNKKKNWRKPYSPSYRIPKIQKDAMDNVFNMARTLMEFKDKEEQRMRQPHFPKK